MKLLKTYMVRLSVVLLAILGGCATSRPNSVDLRNEKSEIVCKMTVDPVMLSGIPYTEDIRTGNFVAVLGDVPQVATWFSEFDALRIRYQAHAVGSDGREYPAYAIDAGFIGGARRYIVIVEGIKDRRSDIRVQTYSTLFAEAYSLKGERMEGFDEKKALNSERYRAQICATYGTPLSECRLVTGMRKAIGHWDVYKTPSGPLATPFSEQDVKYLAGINPQYGYWEKLTSSANLAVSPLDYVSSTIGIAMDFIRAFGVKSVGLDYQSVQSRQKQGINMMILEAQRQKDVRRMLQTIKPPAGGGTK
ncbi:MAG: hypothetical protein WCJ25_01035 [Candidatus Moraniibacteriota bacterium]